MMDQASLGAVWLADAKGFIGSGFFLRRDVVLTAAHVLYRAEGQVTVHWGGEALRGRSRLLVPGVPGDGDYYAYPDLGLVEVTGAPSAVGAPPPDVEPPVAGDRVVVCGYGPHTPERGVRRDTLLLEVVGPAGSYLRLRGDEVRDGFSGAMVLTSDGSGLVGVLKASRDFEGVRGGWCTPVAALREALAAEDPRLAGELGAPARATGRTQRQTDDVALLEILEAVPDVDDPDFRRRLIRAANAGLPADAPLQVPFSHQQRDHLFGLLEACRYHRDPQLAWSALTAAVDALRPGSAAAARLRGRSAEGG